MKSLSQPVVGVVLASLVIIAGCANPARERSVRAIASLDSTRSELTQSTSQINDILATLDQLESRPADLQPVYKTFVRQVNGLENSAESIERRVRDMRVRSNDYNAAWEADNQTIANPQLRAAATQRTDRVSTRYEEVAARAQEMRRAYDPFINELRDLETFLSNDLTYAGITAAKPVFGTVRDRAATLKESVSALRAELDETYTRLSPTTVPAR